MINHHSHRTCLRTAALYTALICSICTICTGCGNTTHTTDDTASTASDAATGDSAITDSNAASGNPAVNNIGTVDTDTFDPMLFRELSRDLSADQVEDTISVFLWGWSGDVFSYAEKLVSRQARSIQVIVTDGVTGETLYDRTFSIDHIGEGQLSLVTDQNASFLLETDCHEQMGYAAYTGEVFGWKDGEKVTVDSFEVHFPTDIDAALRDYLNGETLISRAEVIQDFRDGIERWSEDSEILVACDCINDTYRLQDVFISTDEKPYSAEDFYSLIWERPSTSYSAGEFEELMGYSGYYIYETKGPFCTGYFFSQEGQLIADAGYTAENETFLVDLDKDGSTELISNVMWADGGMAVLIFRKQGGVIERGYADDLLDVEYDNLHFSCEYARYLPEENVVEIFYWISADESYHSKKYEIDLDKIPFYRYEP